MTNPFRLSPVQQKFVLHWSEIGTRSGINPSVAKVHALLYVADRPLNADEIAQALETSRSSVSSSLRELQGWGLIRLARALGDRHDRFESLRDTWEMCLLILDERKRREIDPAIEALKACIGEAGGAGPEEEATRRRLQDLLQFYEVMTTWYEQVRRLPKGSLVRLVKLGTRALKLVGG